MGNPERRLWGRIMKEQGLVSTYTVAQYKPHKTASNEATTGNVLDREFEQEEAQTLRCQRSNLCEGSEPVALHLCAA